MKIQVECNEQDSVEALRKERDQLMQELAAMREQIETLEDESRQWEKASLVKLLHERDRLREQLAAKA